MIGQKVTTELPLFVASQR